jgi:hypothetical protein
MMKKLLSSCAIALFVVALATGGAWAQSVIDIAAADGNVADADVAGTATGAYVVGSEWLAGQAGAVTVDLGSAIPTPGGVAADRSDIYYVPAIDIGVNHSIVITVANGAIAPNVNYGIYDDVGATQVADLIDFVADGSGNYTSMTFKFTAAVVTGTEIALTEDGAAPAAANRPTLRFTSAQLATGPMTLRVTQAYDDTSLPLVAPLTAAETVAMRTAQLSATVQYVSGAGPVYTTGNATSVIDVEATPVSRSKFVAETNGDTTATTSSAALLVASATVNNGIVVANAAYTITIHGNQSAIATVDLEGTVFTEGADTFTLTSSFAAHDLTAAGSNDVDINVNGTSIIDTATYSVTLVIDPAELGVANQTSLNQVLAYVWTVNAMQARVPYMICETGGDNYTFFLEITNRGSQAANLSVDAVISDADGTVNTTETQNDVLTIPANSVIIVREADLDGWLTAVDDTALYRLGLVLTVVAPQNTVDITAYQIDLHGRTAVQVLYNTNNANDGRVWQ